MIVRTNAKMKDGKKNQNMGRTAQYFVNLVGQAIAGFCKIQETSLTT